MVGNGTQTTERRGSGNAWCGRNKETIYLAVQAAATEVFETDIDPNEKNPWRAVDDKVCERLKQVAELEGVTLSPGIVRRFRCQMGKREPNRRWRSYGKGEGRRAKDEAGSGEGACLTFRCPHCATMTVLRVEAVAVCGSTQPKSGGNGRGNGNGGDEGRLFP